MRNLDTRPSAFTTSSLAEVTRLHDAQERMRGALDSFARYVPTDLVRELLDRGEAAKIGGRTEELTVLFTDIEGFTTVSEGLSPAELTAHMAAYFDVMLTLLRESGATIDKLIGDAIVAFWGAPNPVPEHPRRAVEGVLACRRGPRRTERRVGSGGQAPAPDPIRSRHRDGRRRQRRNTVASPLHGARRHDESRGRLEGANKLYGSYVLAEEGVVTQAGDAFLWRKLDRVAVKGRTGAVDVFELLGRRSDVSEEVRAYSARFEAALADYQSRDFQGALDGLVELAKERRDDPAVQRLSRLCRTYLATPPGEDWDGVARLTRKS